MVQTKFWHVMQPKRLRVTIAVSVPSKETLRELANQMLFDRVPAFFEAPLGIALVNPKDQHFVKKIGRYFATKNIKQTSYHLMAIEPTGEGTTYKFIAGYGDFNKNPLHINFFSKPSSRLVHVSFVNVAEIKRR